MTPAAMAEPVKLVTIITRLNVGGPALMVIGLTRRLRQYGYLPLLVTGEVGPDEADMQYVAREYGVMTVHIPELGRRIKWNDDFIAFWKLTSVLRRTRPAIVHTHTAKAGTLGRLAAFFCRVPVIVHTYHGHVFHGYFSSWQTQLVISVERWLARLSDKIIAISQSQQREIAERYRIAPANKIATVPIGFDLEQYLSLDGSVGGLRRELGLAGETPLVGIVGRLVPIKNHTLFLQSAAKICQRNSQVHFVIVGGGELEKELRGQAERLQISSRVHFLGWRQDLEEIYASLDVMVLCSINEGTPVVVIEAMAAGKPVVATSVGGLPDLIVDGQSGYLVPPGDAQGLAEGILPLLQDRDKALAFGQRGRESVRQRFTSARLAAEMDRLYRSLL